MRQAVAFWGQQGGAGAESTSALLAGCAGRRELADRMFEQGSQPERRRIRARPRRDGIRPTVQPPTQATVSAETEVHVEIEAGHRLHPEVDTAHCHADTVKWWPSRINDGAPPSRVRSSIVARIQACRRLPHGCRTEATDKELPSRLSRRKRVARRQTPHRHADHAGSLLSQAKECGSAALDCPRVGDLARRQG